MNTQTILLKQIKDNPYQKRTDYADVEALAISIATHGLEQTPRARPMNGHYELKFGHRRLRAFQWLQANWKAQGLTDRYAGYSAMPLDVEELTDRQMFEGVVVENEQRKDTTPIEKARAIRQYLEEFKATSREAGALFGMADATVRGMVRLLDLPGTVQTQIATGEITQNAARKLLTLARIDESLVLEAAEDIAAGEDADDVVETHLRGNENTVEMWVSYRQGKARGGYGLWDLDLAPEKFPVEQLPPLGGAALAKVLGMEFKGTNKQVIEEWIALIGEHPDQVPAYLGDPANATDVVLIERIGHLLAPPACTACPFHVVADGSHYCGFKLCHERKRDAWVASELPRIAKKMKLKVYDPARDGKDFLPLNESKYQDEHKRHDKLVQDGHADLRLQPNKSNYEAHAWTNSHHVRVILTGKGAVAAKEKEKHARSSNDWNSEANQRKREREQARREAARKFIRFAAPLFGQAFTGLDNLPALAALADVNLRKGKTEKKKSDVLIEMRTQLAQRAFNNLNLDWKHAEKGPIAVAKHLQGMAAAWKVKLPKDFLETAKGYEPAVAVETGKGQKP